MKKVEKGQQRGEDGKTYYVPENMTYEEWKKEFVNLNIEPEEGSKEKMADKNTIIWSVRKEKISKDQYKSAMSYARENGIEMSGFKQFRGNYQTLIDIIDDAASVVNKYSSIRAVKKRLTIRLDYMLNPEDFAITRGHIVSINANAYNDIERLADEYEKLVNEGGFVRGTDYHSIIKHEIGHVISNLFKVDGLEIAKTITNNQSTAEIMCYLENNLSVYSGAYKDGSEIISECFASVYGSSEMNNFALRFIDECDKIVIDKEVLIMTMDKEFMYWRTNKKWYRVNKEKDCFELTDQATERAKKSFEMYIEKQKIKTTLNATSQR